MGGINKTNQLLVQPDFHSNTPTDETVTTNAAIPDVPAMDPAQIPYDNPITTPMTMPQGVYNPLTALTPALFPNQNKTADIENLSFYLILQNDNNYGVEKFNGLLGGSTGNDVGFTHGQSLRVEWDKEETHYKLSFNSLLYTRSIGNGGTGFNFFDKEVSIADQKAVEITTIGLEALHPVTALFDVRAGIDFGLRNASGIEIPLLAMYNQNVMHKHFDFGYFNNSLSDGPIQPFVGTKLGAGISIEQPWYTKEDLTLSAEAGVYLNSIMAGTYTYGRVAAHIPILTIPQINSGIWIDVSHESRLYSGTSALYNDSSIGASTRLGPVGIHVATHLPSGNLNNDFLAYNEDDDITLDLGVSLHFR